MARGRARADRRAEGHRTLPRHRAEERHLGAPRPHAADQPGGLRGSAAGAHGVQLQGGAAQEPGRADRLVRDRQSGRAAERRRGDEARAASACGGAVLRFRTLRGGAAHPRQARFRPDQPQGGVAAQQAPAAGRRSEGDARRAGEMEQALRGALPQAKVSMGKESHYSSKKDRVFVRGIQGQYSLKDELARLRSLPRVIKGRDITFNDGPQSFSKHFVEPVDGLGQTLHVHLEEYAPGGRTQKHGHVNEAAFYILDGVGYEVHDGVRYDWKAGDVAIVHMNCVHQHFNASTEKPARALVMKPKPLIMFMNMLFQQTVIPRQKEAACPAGEGYKPRNLETNLNHDE